jgi:hypothetical protein
MEAHEVKEHMISDSTPGQKSYEVRGHTRTEAHKERAPEDNENARTLSSRG